MNSPASLVFSQVLLLGRGDGDKERLSFGDLRARAAEAKADKGRDLIRVIRSGGGKSNVSAAFSLMSPSELEVAVRMARQKKSRVIHERVSLDGEGQDEAAGSERIREKQLVISANLGEEHLQLTTRRVRKWLEKGRFQVREQRSCPQKDSEISRFVPGSRDCVSFYSRPPGRGGGCPAAARGVRGPAEGEGGGA